MDVQSMLELSLLTVGFAALMRIRSLRRREDVSQAHRALPRFPLRERLINVGLPSIPLFNTRGSRASALRLLEKKGSMFEGAPNRADDAA